MGRWFAGQQLANRDEGVSSSRALDSGMREFLMGVLGAALVYPLAWYAAEPTPMAAVGESSAHSELDASVPPPGSKKSARALQHKAEVREQQKAGEGPIRDAANAPSTQPARRRLLPLPEALPKTIEQMRELQHFASNPDALADRVQTMESNDAELAELEAFAEKFVELPRNRVDERINGTSESGAERPRRPAKR